MLQKYTTAQLSYRELVCQVDSFYTRLERQLLETLKEDRKRVMQHLRKI